MITHKFREVMAYADDVTVLRRGRLAGAGQGRRAHAATQMAAMMIGAQRAAAGRRARGDAPGVEPRPAAQGR